MGLNFQGGSDKASATSEEVKTSNEQVDPQYANGLNLSGNNQGKDNFESDGDAFFNSLYQNFVTEGNVTANLSKMKEEAEKIITNKKHNVKVLILDKTIMTNLGYSSLVYYKIYDGMVRYFISLIASSGRKALTAKETLRLAELSRQDQNTSSGDALYTYSDAIDKVLHGIIINKIAASEEAVNKDNFAFVPLDGIIIPYDTDPLQVLEQVTISAVNAFVANEYLDQGKGLSIPDLKRATQGKSLFKYSIETHKNGFILDRLSSPIKADFTATIELKDTNKQVGVRSVNRGNLDKVLAQASGYVTALPVWMGANRVNQLQQPLPSWVIAPHIVITNIRTSVPDTPSMLLGVIAGALVGSQKQYIKVIMDTMTDDRNPGWYNLLTRNVIEKGGKVKPINVTDISYSPADRAIAIDTIFDFGSPVISVDATTYGEGYDRLAILAWSRDIQEARNDIMKSLNVLTSGGFQDNGENIVFSKNILPAGTYATKKEERDIRDLEFEKILSLTNLEDETAINMFLGSLGKDNQNTYNEKTELLANFIPDAYLNTKTVRLTLDPEFIKTLIGSVQKSGLIAQVDNAFILPTAGFRSENLSSYGNYRLDDGFSGSITYNTGGNMGGLLNYNNYNLFTGFGL